MLTHFMLVSINLLRATFFFHLISASYVIQHNWSLNK